MNNNNLPPEVLEAGLLWVKKQRTGTVRCSRIVWNGDAVNTAWIELQLAHVDKNTIRGTYNHAQYLEQRREMLQWYGDYIDGLGNGETSLTSKMALRA